MVNTIFIKESFIKTLTSPTNTIEEAKTVFKNDMSQGALYNLVNRNEYLKETCHALNSDEQKLIFLSGFQGTGKTEFINTLIYALEENILNFYYECSSVTHLDDIILSLFNYLKKIAIKNPEYKRAFKISNSQSIDERLMNFIKTINIPLLITIDGFENLTGNNPTEEQKELIHFLEFLSSISEIKIIISGQRVNLSSLKTDPFEIRLSGLEEQEASKILKDIEIIETESGLQQIFQVTRGYPENLLWFSNAVNTLNISSFDLLQEYYSKEQKSFEEFIYQKIYKTLPDELLKTIYFFAAIRHSVTLETLEKLNFTSKIRDKINYLTSKMLIIRNREVFYIKSLLKNTVYSSISHDEKKQIHRYLYEIYSEQISKKLEERIFHVSRKLLYSEQYYHYMCLTNYGDKSLPDLKTTTLSNLKPDFKYLYTNITDSLFVGNQEAENNTQTITHNSQTVIPNTQPVIPNLIRDLSNNERMLPAPSMAESGVQNDNNTGIDDISDLKIELSEEEKALLSENEADTDLQSKDNLLRHCEQSEAIQKSLTDKWIASLTSLRSSGQALQAPRNDSLGVQHDKKGGLEEKIQNLKSEATNFYENGKFDEAAKKFEETLILYEILKDKANVNRTLISIANIYNEGFRHDVALMYYYRILSSENETMETEPRIEALCGIADIYDYREDFDNALKFYQKALEEAEKSNNIKQKAAVYFKKALAYDDLGDLGKALEFYLKNTNISGNIEINPNIAAAFANMAAIYEEREDLNKAKDYYSESLKFDKLINNKEGQFETLSNIGNIYFETLNYQNANNYFHEALAIAREMRDTYKIAMSCLDIGDIYLREKHYEKALKAFIIAGKTIEKTISTDSREKIDRRLKKVMNEIGEHNFKKIIEKLKKKP